MRIVLICLAAVLALSAAPSYGHHGWGFYATGQPVYLRGRVTDVIWRSPHPFVTIQVSSATMPSTLSDLPVPSELAELGFDEVLAKTQRAPSAGDWRLDLAPINRLYAWGMPREPEVGDEIIAIGFPSCSERHVARPAIIVIDGVGVRQQSVALPAGCSGLPRG